MRRNTLNYNPGCLVPYFIKIMKIKNYHRLNVLATLFVLHGIRHSEIVHYKITLNITENIAWTWTHEKKLQTSRTAV